MKSGKQDADSNKKIMVVEDSSTQRELIRHLLESHGFEVIAAADGRKALDILQAHAPTLVVSDIVMPEMDGFELCQEIKSNDVLKDIPVILLTSLTTPQDIIRGLECGADNFIRKPYNEKYLLSRIDYMIANRKLRKSDKLQMGVELLLAGKRHFITAERQQILDLLISTYDQAVHLNEELETRTAELEAANKELESFSYSVSHDLRAPLRHMDGFVDLLRNRAGSLLDNKSLEYLGIIASSAKEMGMLIDELLAFSRLGRSEMRKAKVAVEPLVREVIHSFVPDTQGRTIHWQIDRLPEVQADPYLLKQVFVNLLSNAVKYTRDKPEAQVHIKHGVGEKEDIFAVQDNGAGFDMRYANKLFGVFRRLHRAEEFEGVGIGLANVRRIVKRHGGRTWAEGKVGEGATFYFSLPR